MNDPTKPYELTLDEREHYLYARITADTTNVPMSLEYWTSILAKCRELDLKRLLVEQIIPGGLSTTEMFTLATSVAAMKPLGVKIAFVDPFPHNYEMHQFGELAASNRGLWAKVFTTVPEAENWLLQGTDG
jgi:hypothetical protein